MRLARGKTAIYLADLPLPLVLAIISGMLIKGFRYIECLRLAGSPKNTGKDVLKPKKR